MKTSTCLFLLALVAGALAGCVKPTDLSSIAAPAQAPAPASAN